MGTYEVSVGTESESDLISFSTVCKSVRGKATVHLNIVNKRLATLPTGTQGVIPSQANYPGSVTPDPPISVIQALLA